MEIGLGSVEIGLLRRGRRRLKPWAQDPIEPEHHLVRYWLKAANSRANCRLANILNYWGLIASEWAAVRHMYGPGGASSLSIARAIGMSKGGASKLVDRLVKKGFAFRGTSRSDRRFRPVRLTRYAEGLVAYIAEFDRECERELVPRDSPERVQLMTEIKKLARAPLHCPAMPPLKRPTRRGIFPVPWHDPELAGSRAGSAQKGRPSLA